MGSPTQRRTREQAIASAGAKLADSDRAVAQMTPREQAEAAWTPTSTCSVDEARGPDSDLRRPSSRSIRASHAMRCDEHTTHGSMSSYRGRGLTDCRPYRLMAMPMVERAIRTPVSCSHAAAICAWVRPRSR